jgi:hypothetical protein
MDMENPTIPVRFTAATGAREFPMLTTSPQHIKAPPETNAQL